MVLAVFARPIFRISQDISKSTETGYRHSSWEAVPVLRCDVVVAERVEARTSHADDLYAYNDER